MVRNLGILNVLLSLPTLVDQCITELEELALSRMAVTRKMIVIGGMSNKVRARLIHLGMITLRLDVVLKINDVAVYRRIR